MSEPVRVLVCGGRVGVLPRTVPLVLRQVQEMFGEIIIGEGDAQGYDRLCAAWARVNNIPHVSFPIMDAVDGADIKAPKRRNARMLRDFNPQVCVGFDGGPGTQHMLDLAHAAGVRCMDVEVVDGRNLNLHFWPPLPKHTRLLIGLSASTSVIRSPKPRDQSLLSSKESRALPDRAGVHRLGFS